MKELNLSTSDSEILFEQIGSTWLLDTIYIFIITPIGFIGLALNLITLYVLYCIKQNRTKLYEYLKLYTFISLLICFICSFTFMSFSARYYSNFTNYVSRFYRSFVITSLLSTFSFIIYLADILLALDRLSIFIERFKAIRKIRTIYLILIMILTSLIMNLSIYFSYYVKSDDEFYDGLERDLRKFYFTGRTPFFYSHLNYVFTIIEIIVRDVIVLFLEIFTSLMSIHYYKIYESKSKTILNSNVIELVNTIMKTITIDNVNSTRNHQITQLKKDFKVISISNSKKCVVGKQLILMTSIMSFSSIVSHILSFASFLIGSNGPSQVLYSLLCIGFLFLAFKHSSNLFIFYYFNSHFNSKLKTIYCNDIKCVDNINN